MAINSGVYPVFENKFKIGAKGRASAEEDMANIMEMVSISVSIDGNVEEWTPMDSEGWKKRLTTGKGLTITGGIEANSDYMHKVWGKVKSL